MENDRCKCSKKSLAKNPFMSYKILSLDDGGSWALVQARVLIDIYGDTNGHELLHQFDMAIERKL